MRGYVTDPSAPGGLRLADDLPEPVPGPDELLVEVRAYSVNRGELALLRRRPDGWRPGQDLAGVVLRGAPDGGGPGEGTRVVGLVDWECWAERVAVPRAQAVALEATVGFGQAASLPIAGLTALRALRAGGPLLGRRVLVTGATGGVGQFAVQLAAAAGADVTAQVSGAGRVEAARRLGAGRVVVDLSAEGGSGAARSFDLVADGVGGEVLTAALRRLAHGGVVATYGTVGGPASVALSDFPPGTGAPGRVVGLYYAHPPHTRGEDLATLAGLVADGRLRPLLGRVADWRETGEVLDALRRREVRGKAVLEVA